MSKDSQDTSVPAQRIAIAAMAKAGGDKIVREYVDAGTHFVAFGLPIAGFVYSTENTLHSARTIFSVRSLPSGSGAASMASRKTSGQRKWISDVLVIFSF